jgi:ABC-type Na+ transport system ATPase subunit NatA
MAVIEVSDLHKEYGPKVAVDTVSFTVRAGEIFGILGPNGAGKTTTVECAVGLRKPDRGRISVLGLDPQRDHEELRELVGVQLQDGQLPDKLRVREALDLYASFYRQPADAGELIERLGLGDRRDTAFAKLSGGQKQRLSVALALIGTPTVAVLDELTTGLDPAARREVWGGGADLRDPRYRRDDPAGHALHGRGRTAVRPGGGDRQRPGDRDGHAVGAGQPGRRRAVHPVPRVGAAGRDPAGQAARGVLGPARG